jgi:hypothetical protein
VALTYSDISTQAASSNWISRVKVALISTAVDVKTSNAPATSLAARQDRLARAIIADPDTWAARFAVPVALGFVADNLLSAVSDAAIFARIDVIYDDFLALTF